MLAIWGANGFIGRHLVRALSESGPEQALKLFARDFQGFPFALPENAECHERDFTDPQSYIDRIVDCQTLVLLTSSSGSRSNKDRPEREIEQNVHPYDNLFTALSTRKNEIEHIIYLSSGGTVYGNAGNTPISEETPLNPISPYGKAKCTIEQRLMDFSQQSGIAYTILRVANPVGIWTKKPNLVSAALNSAITGQPLDVYGDGSNIRDYFDVTELAQCIAMTVKNQQAHNQIFNVGSGQGHAVNHVVRLVEEISGKQVKTNTLPPNKTDVRYNVLDCNRIEKAMGWKAVNTLDKIIKSMLESA